MKKTLGGDRLGAGKRMQVELHGYERSTHDLGYIWRSTMSAGTLVPFMSKVALPGDTWDINLDIDGKTHPTIGPLFGSYKMQLDVFLAPIRLYQSALHNNALEIGLNMSQIKLPQIQLTATQTLPAHLNKDMDNSQINPSCLLAYLGIRGIGHNPYATDYSRDFNAIPILAYWEIYKNYYSNKQEKVGAVIHRGDYVINPNVEDFIVKNGSNSVPILQQGAGNNIIPIIDGATIEIDYTTPKPTLDTIVVWIAELQQWVLVSELGTLISDTAGKYTILYDFSKWGYVTFQYWTYLSLSTPHLEQPKVQMFPLGDIDRMREAILSTPALTQFKLNDWDDMLPYVNLYSDQSGIPFRLSTQEGLGLKTYQSDMFNNWLDSEYMDAINDASAVSTAGGSFTMPQLLLSKKVYEMLNRIAVSGGSYDDWLDATYAHDRIQRSESPMYMGGLIRELVFQEVISNAASEGQVLGTLAGKGVMAGKKKGGSVYIKVDEPSYIIGIVSLTPRIDYSQGNDWQIHLKTMDDFHKPALDQIGFQDDITERRAWWDTYYDDVAGEWITRSAGKQPAWLNYMTDVNKTYGNFAIKDNEMFMTLNRRYEYGDNPQSAEIQDLTTYIDPMKFNFIFAETSLDAQNFWVQIAVDITARRKMSAKIMPNL